MQAPAVVRAAVQSPGGPLASAVRNFYESRFEHDFSGVRIHTDDLAAASARAVNARAYTVGRHVVFGDGQFAPSTRTGGRLLAHELAHVVQQGHARNPGAALTVGEPDSPAEREADSCAARVADGRQIAAPVVATRALQRKPDDRSPRADPLAVPLTEDEWGQVYMWLGHGEIGVDPFTDDADHNADLVAQAIFCHRYLFARDYELGDPLLCIDQALTIGDPRVQAIRRHVTSRGPLRYSAAFLAGADRPRIRAYYFQGTTGRRAMIVGGVHGSERAGVQVVELLLEMLRTPDQATGLPRRLAFDVIVVPELFPANVASGRRSTPGARDPNRQMPPTGETVGTRQDRRGRPLSARDEPIEPENLVLLDLVDQFRPERMAMVHGVATGRLAGISTDPRPGQESVDDALAAAMAQAAVDRGVRVPGNAPTGSGRYGLGATGEPTRYPTSAVAHEPGVTFGTYGSHAAGPRPAMNMILIETFRNYRIEDRRGRAREQRQVELTALATVLREIFLEDVGAGSP